MINITVIGVDKVQKMLSNYIKWANLTLPHLTEQEADWGARKAIQIAPKQTRALIQAIGVEAKGKNDWRIVSRTPASKGRGRTVPYQKYIHLGLYGRGYPKRRTGDHQYMYTVGELLSIQFPRKIQKSLNKVR